MELKIRGREVNVVPVQLVMALGAGLGIGSVAGFLLGRHVAAKNFAWQLATEVESAKQYYQRRAKASGTADHEDERAGPTVGEPGLEESIRKYGESRLAESPSDYIITSPDPAGAKPPLDSLVRGVPPALGSPLLDEPDEHGDYPPGHPLEGIHGSPEDRDDDEEDGELTEPEPDPSLDPKLKPFVISREEFEEVEHYRKLTITYYVADKVLVDDKDNPIKNKASVAGRDFASRFGEKSGDPRILLVRNNRLETDFEILKNDGSYADLVLHYGNPQ